MREYWQKANGRWQRHTIERPGEEPPKDSFPSLDEVEKHILSSWSREKEAEERLNRLDALLKEDDPFRFFVAKHERELKEILNKLDSLEEKILDINRDIDLKILFREINRPYPKDNTPSNRLGTY